MWVIVLLLVGWLWPIPAHSQQLWSGILDPSRAVDWTMTGVPGGIPSRTTICATIDPYTGSASTINTAIASCPAGQVVKLNAGTFNLSDSIIVSNKSNVTVRGAGPNQTFLRFSGVSSCMYGQANVCIANFNFPYANGGGETAGGQTLDVTLVNWTAGYAQGSTVLTVSNGAVVPVGQIVFLDELGDSTAPNDNVTPFVSCAPQYILGATACTSGRGGRPIHEGHKVVSKNGNQITITPPVAFTNWLASRSPQMWWMTGSTFESSGVEDVSVENLGTDSLQFSLVQIRGCIGCWVKNVRTIKSGRDHIGVVESIFSTVQSNYLYGSVNPNGGTTTYGVELIESYFCRVENNIGQSMTTPFIINGAAGNVYSYNYGIRSIYDETGPNSLFMIGHLFPTHAATVGMNLWEGNEANGLVLDLAHGTASLTTIYRNRLLGLNPGNPDNQNTIPFENIAFIRLTNAVGNVLGTSGYHTNYESSQGPQGVTGDPNHTIWYLGWPGSGEQISGPGYDARVLGSLLRWKNCDYATNSCRSVLAEVPAGHLTPSSTLPPSFYLLSKPGWFSSVSWPPIGPDVTGGADAKGWAKHIPAQVCYSTVMAGPSDGTGAVLAFNPASCYGASSSDTTPPAAPQNVSVR